MINNFTQSEPLYLAPGDYRYDRDDHWKKDEILAAKIKKFLAVRLQFYVSFFRTNMSSCFVLCTPKM